MITIVTDATASITREEAEKMGVVITPMTFTAAGVEYSDTYLGDHPELAEMLRQNPNMPVSTSQTPLSVFQEYFSEIISRGEEILCITISSRLSGTFSNAQLAAERVGAEHIRVVDSRSSSAGILLLIRIARQLINLGRGLDEVTETLIRYRAKAHIEISVSDILPLRRSGRVRFLPRSVSTILNIRPIITCEDGALVYQSVSRGEHEQLRALTKAVRANAWQICVLHVDMPEAAERLRTMLKAKFPQMEITIRTPGPVLAIHLGVTTLAVAWAEQ